MIQVNTIEHMGLREQLEARTYKFDENIIKDARGRELLRLSH